jgi:LysR family transcriptional regulator, nod-box dependent transcriptional activator
MRLDNFDLNLLVAFAALIEERNVTRAARRLNVTQSAMSASLKRLRDSLGDPLLIQHGKTMVPTPHALALAPEVAAAIAALRRLIQPSAGFDPRTSARIFRIVASDYIATVLLVPLLRALESEAPNLRFEIALPTEEAAARLGKGEYDLILTPQEFIDPAHPAELLFEERHVVVGWSGNPALAAPLTPQAFAAAGHVAVRIDGRNTFIENALDKLGLERRIEVHAPSFAQVPWLLVGTRRVALMHERLARLMAASLSLKVLKLPIVLPAMREMAQFHSARETDAGLTWLRAKLRDLARSSPEAAGVSAH